MIRVTGIVTDGDDDCFGIDEPGQLVDVSVGVIANQSTAIDPQNFAGAGQLP